MSGSLGYGQNSSRASSTSSSNSYGYNSSVSGDTSRSMSEGVSGGESQSGQTLAFEDIFRQLYQNASGAAGNLAMQAPDLQRTAQQLFTGGSQFLEGLGGDAGTNYQTTRLNGASPVEDIIASMKTDATDLFNNELNPAITARAVAGGTLGGGRQGVAQGIATSRIASDFAKNAAALRYSDVQSKDAIAADVSRNSLASANTGLASLPGLLDIFERGQNAELAPYSSLSQILGGPTTLTSSSSSNFANNIAQSMSDAFSRAFGEQTAESTSRSRALAHGWNFDSSFAIGGMGTGG